MSKRHAFQIVVMGRLREHVVETIEAKRNADAAYCEAERICEKIRQAGCVPAFVKEINNPSEE